MSIRRWWARLAAAVAGVGLALVVPALAWAGESPAALAVAGEVARRRPRLGGGIVGGLGLLCCLAVVVVVVLLIVMMSRRRR
jgi:hypothetical protein